MQANHLHYLVATFPARPIPPTPSIDKHSTTLPPWSKTFCCSEYHPYPVVPQRLTTAGPSASPSGYSESANVYHLQSQH